MEELLMIVAQSSVLILSLLLLRRLFMGRVNPILQYSLWGIVGLRLFIPVSVESALSIFNLIGTDGVQTVAGNAANTPTAGSVITWTAPAANPATAEAIDAVAKQSGIGASQAATALTAIWLFGMAAVLIYTVILNLRFYLHIRKCGSREGEYTVCPDIASPCLIGVFRPRIVLNQKAASNETALRYALLHEQTHLAHRDNIWALFRTAACIVYWFDPLVWIAANVCRRDQEIACDYSVIKSIGEEHSMDYGRTLISLIRKDKRLPALSTAMAAGKSDMKQRLRLIAKRPRMQKITAAVLAAAVITVCAAACTDAVTDKTPFTLSMEEVEGADINYINGDNEYHPYNDAPLTDDETRQVIEWFNGGTDNGKAEANDGSERRDYICINIKGGGIVPIYYADSEHIFFRRNEGTMYSARNPELAGFIEQNAAEAVNGSATAIIGGADGPTEIFTESEAGVPADQAADFGSRILEAASAYLNVPYQFGESGPDALDSAGLIYRALNDAGIAVEHDSCKGYSKLDGWRKIAGMDELREGDLMFFTGLDGNIEHAGIYAGDSKMIDASSSIGRVVMRDPDTSYWREHFAYALRLD